MNWRGWIFLFVLAFAVSILIMTSSDLSPELRNSRYVVCLENNRDRIGILQMSDLHVRGSSPVYATIANDAKRLRPDFIVFTGDTIDDKQGLKPLIAFIETLPTGIPMYAVPGNWEHWAKIDFRQLDALFRKHGGRWLVNDSVLVIVREAMFLLVGLDDATGGKPNFQQALSRAPTSWDGRNLLILAHSPIQRDWLMADPQQKGHQALTSAACLWMLSGHTHGGEIVILGVPLIRAPGNGPYIRGWYQKGGLPMYVSRGIGNSTLPFRIGAPPEWPFFEWYLAR